MEKSKYSDMVIDIISSNAANIDEDKVREWKDRLLRWFSKGDNETYAWIVAEVGIITGYVVDRLEKARARGVEDGAHTGSAMADIIVYNKLSELFGDGAETVFHVMLGTEDGDEVTEEQKAGLFAAISELIDEGLCDEDDED